MKPTINIDKGPIAIINELLAAGEVFEIKKIKTSHKSKKIRKDSG